MFTIVTVVLGILGKVLKLAAKVALNRATVIITFVGGLALLFRRLFASISTIGVNDGGILGNVISAIKQFSLQVGGWASGNDYIRTIGYALSLDVVLDGLVMTLFWFFSFVIAAVFTAICDAFFAILPLLVDLAISGLKKQFANSVE